MEERVEEKTPRSTGKTSLFKRFVCLLLVLSMMLSLTACASIRGEPASLLEAGVYIVGGLIRATILVVGDLTLAGIVWVLDKITWPFYPLTGFNMDKPGAAMFRFFNNLVDPTHVHGDWSDMDLELHDEHPQTIWEKRKDKKDQTDDKVQMQDSEATTAPTDPSVDETGVPHATDESRPMNGDESGMPQETTPQETAPQGASPQTGGEEEDSFLDKFSVTITYDANGGYNAPEPTEVMCVENPLFPNSQPLGPQFLSKDIPFRPGYHFMGWSISPNSTTANHQPGERYGKNTNIKATHDTTLYAVWKEFNGSQYLPEHKYTVEQLGSNIDWFTYQNSPEVRIRCSCGLNVTDKSLSKTQFRNLYFNFPTETIKNKDANKMTRLYLLYLAQDVGPLALELNTSFYQDTTSEDYRNKINAFFDKVNEKCIAVDRIKLLTASDYDKYKHMMSGSTKAVKGFISKLGDTTKKVSTGITVLQAANALYKMGHSEDGVLEQTIGMLDMLDCLFSLLSPNELKGLYLNELVEPVTDTLRAGLKLIGQCAEYRKTYYNNLNYASQYASGKKSQYLYHVFGRTDLENVIGELITGSPVGCDHSRDSINADGNKTGCRFYSGSTLRSCPSVYETMCNMNSWTSQNTTWIIQPEEKELVLFYLTERSRHDLYEMIHLTVEQYVQLINNDLSEDIYANLP